MKTSPAKLLDVVAGQVGIIVEVLAPDVFEVEFCDIVGNTIGFAELCRHEFLVLSHEAALAA